MKEERLPKDTIPLASTRNNKMEKKEVYIRVENTRTKIGMEE
jgi:hypothetical protein